MFCTNPDKLHDPGPTDVIFHDHATFNAAQISGRKFEKIHKLKEFIRTGSYKREGVHSEDVCVKNSLKYQFKMLFIS